MTFKAKLTHFFALPFWRSWTTITVIYALIPIIIGLLKWHKNNDTYHIYKSVFWNTINQLPLYEFYDYLKGDCNHYGAIFAYVQPLWCHLCLRDRSLRCVARYVGHAVVGVLPRSCLLHRCAVYAAGTLAEGLHVLVLSP